MPLGIACSRSGSFLLKKVLPRACERCSRSTRCVRFAGQWLPKRVPYDIQFFVSWSNIKIVVRGIALKKFDVGLN
jgi:hypothetical protein